MKNMPCVRRLLFAAALTLISAPVWAQITITPADMPVAGDTLRYSNALGSIGGINAADSGTGMTWNYVLTPTGQGVDTFKTGAQVSPAYTTSIPSSYAGYKVADSIPGIGLIAPGISISNIYNFFSEITTPSAYIVAIYAASISGIPISTAYTQPDAWYFFPLTYGRQDSSDFAFHFSLLSTASIKQEGYRKTRVDGWGTITTPYYTTPVNCIRVRSEVHEIDSIGFGTTNFGLPRTTIEYKWLVSGEHYPALWVTSMVVAGMEVPTSVRYRDVYRSDLNNTSVSNTPTTQAGVTAYPVPTANGIVNIGVPAGWKEFSVEVFDVQSKLMGVYKNQHQLNIAEYPVGNYVARITSGNAIAYVQIVK